MFDVFSDVIKWCKSALCDMLSMAGDLLKHPVVKRLMDDRLKGLEGVFKGLRGLREKKASSKWLDIAFQASIVVLLVIAVISLMSVGVFFQVSNRFDSKSYVVNIPAGSGASDVSDILIDKRIIDNRYSFDILLGFLGIENKIQAGVYKLSPSMGLGKIVLKLRSGDIISGPLERVFFPEGTSIYKMGVVLQESGFKSGIYFEDLMKDPISEDLRQKFPFLKGVKINSLEGFLFPDTYLFPPDATVSTIRDLMLSRFNSVVMGFWEGSSKDTDMTLHEIMTLASIVEKEAAIEEERPIIASVFLNRLKKRMHLAADPTVKYALSMFRKPTKRVYFIDLEVDSPYNTYKYAGLPPGPISNPGIASIKAAVYPAKTQFLYFVARKDGTHIFSTTWQEHERAKVLVRGE